MQKTLISTSFLIATLAVFAAFLTATTYTQLTVAIVIYPILIYFAFKAFTQKPHSNLSEAPFTASIQPEPSSEEILEEPTIEKIGIADIDKRAFLKLIGGAGITLFLFSIFNKKAEGMFFKSAPASGRVALEDPKGNVINPARHQPTDGYKISEIDNDEVSFYGFTNMDGAWYVMREESMGSFRYARGDSDFPFNWSRRKNLKYDYYGNIFKNIHARI